jgi:hypothetical protein
MSEVDFLFDQLFNPEEEEDDQMNQVQVLGKIIKRTEKAVLFQPDAESQSEDHIDPVWLPLSQIEITEGSEGENDLVEMPEWLAAEKQLTDSLE